MRKSAVCNTVYLVVDSSGDVFATTFKKLPSIKTTHHFRMSAAHPGKVFTKENCSSPEVEHCLLRRELSWTQRSYHRTSLLEDFLVSGSGISMTKFGSSALPLTKTLRVLSHPLFILTVGRGLQSLLPANLTPSLQPSHLQPRDPDGVGTMANPVTTEEAVLPRKIDLINYTSPPPPPPPLSLLSKTGFFKSHHTQQKNSLSSHVQT